MQALLSRASSLMGSEYGVRQRSSKTAMRALFSIWAVRTREAAEEAAEAEARAKAAAHALQLADLERARSDCLRSRHRMALEITIVIASDLVEGTRSSSCCSRALCARWRAERPKERPPNRRVPLIASDCL